MYLSDRDLAWAIEKGTLIVSPSPEKIDPTSIDLHLDHADGARVWDMRKYDLEATRMGNAPKELRVARVPDFRALSNQYTSAVPSDPTALVFRRGDEIVVKPLGFVLWQTRETVGTPEDGADFICFVNAKSTRARAGVMVHLTAPTIHASWSGNVTLEIANMGPFHLVLHEGDVLAQLTCAKITSIPKLNMKLSGSLTVGQTSVTGEKVAASSVPHEAARPGAP